MNCVCLGELPAARRRCRLRLRAAPVSGGQQQPADAGVAAVPGCDGSRGGLPSVSRTRRPREVSTLRCSLSQRKIFARVSRNCTARIVKIVA